MQPFFLFSSVRRKKGVSSQAFLKETVETGDKTTVFLSMKFTIY